MAKSITYIFATILLVSISAANVAAQTSITNIVRAVKPSVVTVFIYDASGSSIGHGSGFFLDQSHVITNWHVVKNAGRVKVRTVSGTVYDVKGLSATDKTSDIASLVLTKPDTSAKPLKLTNALPSEGERIIVISTPEEQQFAYTISDGIISGIRTFSDAGRMLQISAPVSAGSSGGPVINMRGEAVGMVLGGWKTGELLNFAVPSYRILALRQGPISALPAAAQTNAGRGPSTQTGNSFSIGQTMVNAGDYEKAIPFLQAAVRQDPSDYNAWYMLGTSYFGSKQFDKAQQAFAQSIKIHDNYVPGYLGLGMSLAMQGDLSDAQTAIKAAITLRPDFASSHYMMGLVYVLSGDKDSALQEYNILKGLDASMASDLFSKINQ